MSRNVVVVFVLLAASCGLGLAAPDQWLEARSSHFTCLTDSNEKQARHVLDQFERMRWVFETLFPNIKVDPPEPILVIAAKNEKTFQSLEPQAYLAKGQLNLAGLFLHTQDRIYILVRLDAEQEHPFVTVYHEYTHLQFRGASAWMPLWLNEGLAEFFQNTEIQDKSVLLGEPSVDDLLYLRQHQLIPLPVLFKVDASSPYYHEEQKGSVFYAESWALTHYLQVTDREKKTDSVTNYMIRMSHHEDPVAAAEKAFGDLKQLQSALEAYILASRYKQFVLNSAAVPLDEASYTFKTISQIEADTTRADVLASEQRDKEARDLIAQILKTDPDNVPARETMGSLEFRSGDRDAALKWYAEAVKLDSQSYLANYYFASLSMDGASADQEPAIESSLRTVIRLNPKFAPAYDRLASFYAGHHMKMDDAISLILQAVKLDPGNLYFRLNAANILAEIGRYPDSAAVLQAATKLAKNPGDLAMIQSRIDQLNQFQQAQARAEQERQQYEAQRAASAQPVSQPIPVNDAPKHPAEANGPKHTMLGVIHHVTCSYPSVLEFQLDGPKKSVNVYNNDFFKIDLSVLGFTPAKSINPCSDFEGMKARIEYAEASDKTVDGQVFAIELRK
ncbi:MAG: DUF1570 domain-containing protein [Terracidiphilus sp.]